MQEIVRNSKVGSEWQTEEKEGDFPFQKATLFDLVIQNDSDEFQVRVTLYYIIANC